MNKHSILVFITIILCCYNCAPKPVLLSSFDGLPEMKEVDGYKSPCSESLNYVPDKYTEKKIVKLNVHLIDSPEQDATWKLNEGKKYYQKVINNANARLDQNPKMLLPKGNDTPVIDPGFRYRVIGLEEGDDGYYYHIDSVHYHFANKGKSKNNYDSKVVKKYEVGNDTILNIFAISHHKDSIKSKKYKNVSAGIALGTNLKMSGLYANRHKPAWKFGGLLNHEIGHVLGLSHAWTRYDGCDDTPVHPNCWDELATKGKTGKPCDGSFSNNVMDYSKFQNAYTPCQIGRIHRGFSDIDSPNRGLIYKTWCDHDPSQTVIIEDHVEWEGNRDLRQNIVIKKGGRLDLHCRLSMAKGSSIKIEKGGELHLHRFASLHNSCGDLWKGIIVEDEKNVGKALFIYGQAKIWDFIGGERKPDKAKKG